MGTRMNRFQIALVSIAAAIGVACGFFAGRLSMQSIGGDPSATGSTSDASNAPAKANGSSKANSTPTDTRIKSETNPLNDTTKYYLVVTAASPGRNSIGLSEYADLMIRCEGSKSEVYLSTPEFLSSQAQTVQVRWNDGAVESQGWCGASGGTALFSKAPITFLSQLGTQDKLVIGYSPWDKAGTSAVFELKDYRQDLIKMQTHCK